MALNLDKIDLGSFGVNTSKEQQSDIPQPDVQLRSTLSEAVKENPDDRVRINNLSRQSGVPAFAVEQDPTPIETKLNLDKIDISTMSKRNPNTAQFLTDFNNASIAHDDIDALQFFENVLKTINPLPSKEYRADIGKAFESGQAQVESSQIGTQRMWAALNMGEPVTDEQLQQLQQLEAQQQASPSANYNFFVGAPVTAAQQLPILGQLFGSAITEASGGAVKGGAVGGSIGVLRGRGLPAPAQAASAVSGVVAGAGLGAQYGARFGTAKASFDLEAGSAFNEYVALKDDQGNTIDEQTAAYAATAVGAINASLEYVSLAAVGRTVTPVMRAMIKDKVRQALGTETGRQALRRIGMSYVAAVGAEAVTEGLQEFTTTVGGELSKLMSSEAFTEQTLSDSLDTIFSEETLARVEEAAVAGAQVGMVFGAPGTVVQTIQHQQQKTLSGENEQAVLDQFNQAATESKLKTRDVEALKQFINDADGDQNTTVFIDAAQASLYLGSKTEAEITADPALQQLRNQVSEASQLGTDVSMSVADFAANIAGTEHFQALRDDMTLSADSISPFRSEQVRVETEQYVQNLMTQAQENASQYVESQEIYETVREQLIDTGMVTPQNASTMAQLVPAWAAVHAQNNNMSVQDVYRQSGLTIEGPQTGRMAELSGQVLEQRAREFKAELQAEFPGVKFGLSQTGNVTALDKIIVPEDQRATGVGSSAMQRIIDWADQNGQTVALTPSADFGGNKKRLVEFYKRFGFVENKGRNKDYEISESMYRPAAAPLAQRTSVTPEARGYYDPANSVIRLTEAADLSTFLHEFAHFMYEMERKAGGETAQKIGQWFKRNAAEVAKEANGYLADERDSLGQQLSFTFEELERETAIQKGLNMSHDARLQRADRLGFDTSTEWYHGTASFTGFTRFDPEMLGSSGGGRDTSLGVYHARSLDTASAYTGADVYEFSAEQIDGMLKEAEQKGNREAVQRAIEASTPGGWSPGKPGNYAGGSIRADFLKTDGYLKVDMDGAAWDENEQYKIGKQAKEEGYKGVIFQNMQDSGWFGGSGTDDIALTFDTADIRDVNAAFDPTAVDSDYLLAQSAFHGTPHKFDRFSLEAIGTGEGAQAYGWGLYFASNRSIAEWYREALTSGSERFVIDGERHGSLKSLYPQYHVIATASATSALRRANADIDAAIEIINQERDKNDPSVPAQVRKIELYNDAEKILNDLRSREVSMEREEGQLYQVDIPESDQLLDWDATLSNQSNVVKSVIEKLKSGDASQYSESELQYLLPLVDSEIETEGLDYDTLVEIAEDIEAADYVKDGLGFVNSGKSVYDNLESLFGSDQAASEFLNAMGIPGLRYLDASSRGAEADQFHNFVIWDEQTVTVEAVNDEMRQAQILAQSPEIPGQLEAGAVTEADVIAFVDNDTTGDQAKDRAIYRAIHEQFARGFETYLMEGKAPSIELRNAFRSFARWLVQIYKQIKGDLKVNLDDEMRQVFDRLIATEEQIAAAEARARYEPMFTDAAMAGMTDEEFAAYKKRQETVRDKETETLRDKLIKEITRQTKRWWRAEKRDLVDEELDALKTEQVYTARRVLREGRRAATGTADADQLRADIKTQEAEIKKIEAEIKKLEKSPKLRGQIARWGGLDRESFEAEGIDPADFKTRSGVFGKPLFPREGGLTADDLAEKLNELDYQGGNLSANDALDLVNELLVSDSFIDPTVDPNIEALERSISDAESAIDDTRGAIEDAELQSRMAVIKLDRGAVREMVGEERTDARGNKNVHIPAKLSGMTAPGGEGVHPDEAAAFFGYASGEEMLADLMNAPSMRDQAEANAQNRMLEKYGDIMNDGSIEQQADEAVQNEERGKLILSELKALSKGTAQPLLDRQMIKAIAEDQIGRLAFREIHPGKYRKAEIKAAQESARMLAEGNREGAAVAKARQVMNYYLGMAATAAKADTMKIVDGMSRYRTKRVVEAIAKVDGGYWDQIVKILERFEFRKSASLRSVDQRNQDINTWMKDRMDNAGDGLVLSAAVLDETYTTHWKNVPYNELKGISDSVKNIEHVARYSNKIDVMQEKVDFDTLVNDWTDHIKGISSKYTTKESRSRAEDSMLESTKEKANKWIASMTKIPFLTSWLDGGERVGMSHDIIMQRFTDALNDKLNLMDEVARPIYDMILNRDKETQARHARKISIPEINDTLHGHQILAVALNTGNQSNLKKLLLGEGWANPDNEAEISFDNPKLQAVLKHMTRQDWVMVQKIWDQMELLYPQLAEVHRKTTGLVPPKIEATPIRVRIEGEVTDFMNMKGGYYPVKYSPKRGYDAEKNAEKQQAETESMFSNYSSINASVNAGATNERTGYYAPILLDLSVIPDHFHETIHFITHHDAVRQMNKLINDKRVQSAITGAVGEAEFKLLKPWLNDIAKDGREQPTKTFIHSAFNQLRFGVTLGAMGFKASTGIMQLFGLFTTAAEVGPVATMKGVKDAIGGAWYMRAVRKTLGSTSNIESSWKFASEKSKVLKHRTDTMDREIRAAMERLSGKRGWIPRIQEVSMKHIALIQTYMVDLPTWVAAYDKTLSETGDEAKAVRYADWAIENLQGSGATKDMAQVLRNQDKIHTTFTMFMTFFSSLGNLSRDTYRGARDGKYSLTNTAAKIMFLYTIPVFVEALIRGDLDEPEGEDERLQKLVTNMAMYPVASVPFVRDVAGGLFSNYGYNVTPVASLLERGIMGYKQIGERAFTDEEISAGSLKGAVKLTGAAFGIPGVNQVWSTGEHLYDVLAEGEDLTLREVLFGPDRD